MGAVFRWVGMPHNDSVLRVAAVPEGRVPAAALLAHVIEDEICGPVKDSPVDGEYLGLRVTRFYEICSRAGKLTEIKPVGGLHPAQRPRRPYLYGSKDSLSGESVDHLKAVQILLFFAKEDGDFGGAGDVTYLADSYPGFGSCLETAGSQ